LQGRKVRPFEEIVLLSMPNPPDHTGDGLGRGVRRR
jgi:hypothetical protein